MRRHLSILLCGPTFVASVFMLASTCNSQMPAAEQREKQLLSVQTASGAGKWREQAVDLSSQKDDSPPSERATRNAFWQAHLPAPNMAALHGFSPPGSPEIFNNHKAVWITATFVSYKIFQPSATDGAYTEVAFEVTNPIANKTGLPIAVGQILHVDILGGTVRLPSGAIRKYNLDYDPFSLQPGHSYLMELSYNSEGGYFEDDRKWDITSGIAIPNGIVEARSYLSGDGYEGIGGAAALEAIAKVRGLVAAPTGVRP